MGVVTNEPSMEDILSSIKRIIADGSDRAAPVRSLRRRPADRDGEAEPERVFDMANDDGDAAVLELTDMVEEPTQMNQAAAPMRKGTDKAANASALQGSQQSGVEDMILSDISTQATRESLSELSSLLVRPQDGEANTLEGLVREMLRPMLKDWLETNLPDMVQSMVKKEIDRIVGRLG